MKALQWTMTIPKEKQNEFIDWFNKIAGPKLSQFGALKHELYKVADKKIVGRQQIEKNKYIERIYFNDSFNIPDYFTAVKNDPQAWKLSRMYESVFEAKEVELRIILDCSDKQEKILK